MVLGLGIDIVQNCRIQRIIEKWGEKFLARIFTGIELELIDRRGQKIQRYAANYAVKEAAVKALGTGFRNGINFHDIQVKRDDLGKPYTELLGKTKFFAEQKGINKVHTSISHERNYSVAVVLVED